MAIAERWLPKSFLALRNYSSARFRCRFASGVDRRLGGAAAFHGVWHLLGCCPASGHLYRSGRWFHDFGLRRLAHANWRPDRRVRSDCGGYCSQVRYRRPEPSDVDGGHHARHYGCHGIGAAVKFIPRPVTIGFTNGIALLIASTQIKDFFGLTTGPVPSVFIARIESAGGRLRNVELAGVGDRWPFLGIHCSLAARDETVPGSIIALLLATFAVAVLKLPARNNWQQVRRRTERLSALSVPRVSFGTHSAVDLACLYSSAAGGSGEPFVRGGGR